MHHIGDIYRVPPRVFSDLRTGCKVRQVSPNGCANFTNYFYMTCFTPDETYLFYNSNHSGTNQVHWVHLETGETGQITQVDGGLGPHDWNLHPSGNELYYKVRGAVQALDYATGQTRLVFDPAAHSWMKGSGVGGPIRFSGSGQFFCFQFLHDPQPCVAPHIWSHYGLVKHARSGIGKAACDGSGGQGVYLHDQDMQHVMFCPADDDLLTFAVWPDYQNNAALMNNHRARAWLVDIKADLARPYLIVPKGHRASHEYWSPAGDRLFYHKRQVDDIWSPPRWFPCYLSYLDRVTGRHVDFFRSDTQRLGHSICTPDGQKVISDNDDFSQPNELIVVDVSSGRSEVLWWPNVTCQDQRLQHGGPIMSTRGTYVGYSSDLTGEAQVYLVRL